MAFKQQYNVINEGRRTHTYGCEDASSLFVEIFHTRQKLQF